MLPNGEVLLQGGSGGKDFPEVAHADGTFRLLTGAPTGSLQTGYPKNFVDPDGLVFGIADRDMYRIDPAGTGSITRLGTYPTQQHRPDVDVGDVRPGQDPPGRRLGRPAGEHHRHQRRHAAR